MVSVVKAVHKHTFRHYYKEVKLLICFLGAGIKCGTMRTQLP